MREEGPSQEDIERFSGESGYCPRCGEEIWDQAEVCPQCGAYVSGDVSSRPPMEAWFRQRWLILVAVILLLAFLFFLL